ncbi:MAG: response regulator transcription factor [Brachymonas sp.]|nr:response regulator transcription factor [Brachymonas sp.]
MQQLPNQGQQLDALLTDLGLPDGSGLELIAYAAQHLRCCDSLVISMFGDEDNVLASIEAGATGYLHKDSDPANIAQCILQLKAGQSPMSPMIARRLLGKYRSMSAAPLVAAQTAPSPPDVTPNFKQNQPLAGIKCAPSAINSGVLGAAENSPNSGTHPSQETVLALPDGVRALSRRETEVLEHIARGFSYAEVADISYVSVHTVQTHIKNIYAKLSVHNRSEAVFEAQRLGLLRKS